MAFFYLYPWINIMLLKLKFRGKWCHDINRNLRWKYVEKYEAYQTCKWWSWCLSSHSNTLFPLQDLTSRIDLVDKTTARDDSCAHLSLVTLFWGDRTAKAIGDSLSADAWMAGTSRGDWSSRRLLSGELPARRINARKCNKMSSAHRASIVIG